ncbi:MAG: glycosyltransferase family 4 protein [Candidatus Eremiobacteraeota bacterium]|nr:glycosyltransferase family 4 protein [Candidatus Eremiobacteraeota bacterium]
MRVLHLLSQKPEATGSGLTVQAVMREGALRGHINYLLAGVSVGERPLLHSQGELCCTYVEFESPGLPFKVAGMSDVMPYPSTRFCDLTGEQMTLYEECFRDKLNSAVSEFQPDLIHANHLWIITSLARRALPDIPVVATSHGTDVRQFHLCPQHRERVLSGCKGLEAVMVLHNSQREEVQALYGIARERLHVTGTGYDERLFSPGKKESGEVQVVYGGKLSRAKGVMPLLEAAALLTDLPWHLHLAGGGAGPEKDEIVERAMVMGGRVTLHGPLPQHELAQLMARSHIFVLPSFYEGFPLVLIEALASGCSLVSTDLPALKELFPGDAPPSLEAIALPPMKGGPDTPDEGALPAFVEALSQALRKQITRRIKETELPAEHFRPFVKGFTWKQVFERIERVYFLALKKG